MVEEVAAVTVERLKKLPWNKIFNMFYIEPVIFTLVFAHSLSGHMQQGGSPTPFDRNMGTKMAAKCVDWFIEQFKNNTKPDGTIKCEGNDSACLLGIVRRQYRFTPLADLISETNFEQRIPKSQWWLKLRPLLRILAKHDSAYEEEGMYITVEEECATDAVA